MGVFTMKDSLESILQPFAIGQISDAIVVMKGIAANGYGIESLERYVAGLVQETKDLSRTIQMEQNAYFAELISKAPKCPVCGKMLRLIEVNSNPANVVGGSIGSIWQCPDMLACGYELDSPLKYREELMKLGVKIPSLKARSSSEVEGVRRRSRGNRLRTTSQQEPVPKPCGGRRR
jgi:hypothetical protein